MLGVIYAEMGAANEPFCSALMLNVIKMSVANKPLLQSAVIFNVIILSVTNKPFMQYLNAECH